MFDMVALKLIPIVLILSSMAAVALDHPDEIVEQVDDSFYPFRHHGAL